jgi:hypothetical protein
MRMPLLVSTSREIPCVVQGHEIYFREEVVGGDEEQDFDI